MKALNLVVWVLVAALAVWILTLTVHNSNAKAYTGPVQQYVQDKSPAEPGPRWKIILTLDGPPGKQDLTYGNQKDGVHWFDTREECEAARKGGDKHFADGLEKLRAMIKAQHAPVTVSTSCRSDDSI
jgi:hypothetical protein